MSWIGMGVVVAMACRAVPQGDPTAVLLEADGWQQAREQGWIFDGERISVQEDVLRIADGGETEAGCAQIAHPGPLPVGDRFAIVLRARVRAIGLDDDGTGGTQWRLQIGSQSPRGAFGAGFTFTGDRYKVDGSYKVFRTDDAWHEWRLELDTARRTAAMFRDGEYICLHRAGSDQPPGLRLQVQGSAGMPALVEVDALRLLSLADEQPPPPSASRPALATGRDEWPLWRRDLLNSGASPMPGGLGRPRVAWSYAVPGPAAVPRFLDLDGDGRKEGLVSYGGNLSALRPDGSPIWRRRVENAHVHGLFDLDGDGDNELLISAGIPAQVQILDARDGQTLYTCELFPKAGVGGVRVARFDPDLKGLQAIVWSPQHELGFRLSFAEGVRNARADWLFDWRMTNFRPEVALADMDGDGLLEVVVLTYGLVLVFDGRSGEREMELKWSSGRNYGTLVLKDVDGDGYPDVVVLADQLREHLAVIKNEGGRSLRLLWDHFYEQNYPEDHKSLRVLDESVDDFDGDGQTEIAYALYDGTADGLWHTRVLDAVSGEIKQDLPGRYLAGAGQVFPDRPPVLLLSEPSARSQLQLDRLSLWTGAGGRWRELAVLPRGQLMVWNAYQDFEPFVWSGAGQPTRALQQLPGSSLPPGLCLAPPGGTGAPALEYLVGDEGAELRSAWQFSLPADLPSGSLAGVEEIVPGQGSPQVVFVGSDRTLRLLSAQGGLIGKAETGGAIAMPVVARLREDTPPVILFVDVYRTLHCLRALPGGGAPRLLWSRPAIGSQIRYVALLGSTGTPFVVDLDGDGEREILVAREPDQLVALDPQGEIKRSWTFPSRPVQWVCGNFDGDDQLDLLATYPRGIWVDMESVALAGRDGRELWRMHVGNGPMAVYDINGDGYQDVILRDLFEHRTLDGRTGRDLHPITMWAGYHTPVVTPLQEADPAPGIVWIGGSYSVVVENLEGEQHWWRPFQATGPQAVADVDGDRRLEVGGVTAGQLYNWPDFYAVDGPDREFVCYAASTGEVQWSVPLNVTAAGAVAADVDGDGRPEFLVGTNDGRLIALRADGEDHTLWELSFPAAVGIPLAADVDGDGRMEILVGCANGELYCVEGEE